MRQSRRERIHRRNLAIISLTLIGAAGVTYAFWPRGNDADEAGPATVLDIDAPSGAAPAGKSALANDAPTNGSKQAKALSWPDSKSAKPKLDTPPKAASQPPTFAQSRNPEAEKPPAPPQKEAPLGNEGASQDALRAATQLMQSGRLIDARAEVNRVFQSARSPAARADARRMLQKLGEETIFSRSFRDADPLVEIYTIQSGDNLVNIGKQFDVPYEIIESINGITPTRIRPGQKIKVPRGPFHARISLSEFRMDVYLNDTFVRSYAVGIGRDNGTPSGKWVVRTRLRNPTYYPPASSDLKEVIRPEDPRNPLGGYWIALEGVEGDTIGQEGFGIHGTNQPETVGKSASLGCIRMLADDIRDVYGMLAANQSTVTTTP
ncbi:MAG: L,D-transpeptidase family protein [Phycisphaerales bacterium]|nr:L,D-transpeptidase family protein [Phycisphaerales bacterium]